jgi:predicted RecB family nuclease
MHLLDDGTLVLSPTDLVGHLECAHLTELERLVAEGRLARPAVDDPALDVLRRRGDEHERSELARLRSEGRSIAVIGSGGATRAALEDAERATAAAMSAGAEVVFQASFFDGRWRGQADFLHRVDAPSSLGPWSYEVVDTKLSRRARPTALVQMASYAGHVARLQGRPVETMAVVTGDGSWHRFPVADVAAYHRAAAERLEAAVQGPAEVTTYPDAVPHCRVCPWAGRCEARRRADDHLSLVAGLRGDAVSKLVAGGIPTVAALAASPDGAPVPRMGQATVDRLRRQARLQLAQRNDGVVRYELLVPPDPTVDAAPAPPGDDRIEPGEVADIEPALGLASLPAPSPGDLFFDIEGDPWVGTDGVEYLFGVASLPAHPDGEAPFRAFWGHTPAEEKRAFEQVVDFLVARLEADPDMHVYHYAPYEVHALRALTGRHATREAEVDRLLRAEVFVDLYRVVRHGVLVSQEGYGLKKLEPLYQGPRSGELQDGGSSILFYERWLTSGDPSILAEIEAYNADDCRSTLGLRDWLEDRRAELGSLLGAPLERPPRRGGGARADRAGAGAEAATAALAEDLRAGPGDAGEEGDTAQGRALLGGVVEYHRREAKPGWWAWFDRLGRSERELLDDHEAVGGLTPEGVVGEAGHSLVHRYRFDPSQEHKLDVGRPFRDPRTARPAGEIVAVDAALGTVDLRRGADSTTPHPRSLVPAGPVPDTVLRDAVAALGRWSVEHGLDADDRTHRGIRWFLLGRPPSVRGVTPGASLARPDEDPSDAVRRLVPHLDGAVLAVQGPPGSGKTWVGAAVVADAVARGRRVAITANSHKAITNLVGAVCRRASADGVAVQVVQKAADGEGCTDPAVRCVAGNAEVVAALDEGYQVVAGTAWLLARPELAGRFDLLVVDEASQLSLANLCAVAGVAPDAVLFGDPRQLPHVSQGTHLPGVAVSALGHLLGDEPTVPPSHGVFLHTSRRMHPELCSLVSEIAYGGQLAAHPDCAAQAVHDGPLVAGSGLRLMPVRHEGNRTRSHEEAAAVAALVGALVGRPWTDGSGTARPLRLDDILVIAPFNAHVACLTAALPAGARVGTVDRFQGQEAPVALYAMAASSAGSVPRGIDFLFSRNRLNVAVSRARALAVVVASPALLGARCHTSEQLRLVNALCLLAERAGRVVGPEEPVPARR